MALRILFIGEIVGRAGIFCIKSMLPALKQELKPDFVIANGDGATGGFGLGKNHAIYLRKLGIDVITSGDQIYFKKDMVEHIERASYILRPANFPQADPGRGWRFYSVATAVPAGDVAMVEGEAVSEQPHVPPAENPNQGTAATTEKPAVPSPHRRREALPGTKTIAVINLLGQSGFSRTHLGNPFLHLPELVARIRHETPIIILDFHALTTAEKSTMFYHADGLVSAVLGSGTRIVTADAEVLPSGTAVISDTGRTGSLNSVSGLDPSIEIQKFLTQIPERSKDAWDNLELQGVVLDIDDDGKATRIEMIRRPCMDVPNRVPDEQNGGD